MDPHILDWFFQGYVAKQCCLVGDWLARLEHPARQQNFFGQNFSWTWGLKSWKCIGQLLKTVLGKASRKVENSQSIAWTGKSKKENRDMSFFIFWPCCNSWARFFDHAVIPERVLHYFLEEISCLQYLMGSHWFNVSFVKHSKACYSSM